MSEQEAGLFLIILLLGGLIVLSIFIRSGLKKIGLPSLVGFMLLGFLIKVLDGKWGFWNKEISQIFEFLASIGIIFLLFRVGLESNLKGLLSQIKHASLIWIGNILFSGVLGFMAAKHLLGLEIIPSLFIGVALTATSVGVSIGVWQEMKAVNSPTGELLLDVAEMDDISGIIFMALLISTLPLLKNGLDLSGGSVVGGSIVFLLVKLLGFGLISVLFSLFLEKPVTSFFSKLKHSPDPMLILAGFGLVIASLAGLLGFSLAMGAFFAGLVFSRDPKAVRLDSSFGSLYDFFVPFFFIGVGLQINPGSLISAVSFGLVLLLVAILGKLIGNGLFSLAVTGMKASVVLSLSMVPRAEIAMVVMKKGSELGEWAVPEKVFSAMVLVSLITCISAPIILRFLLRKWPQKNSH